MQPTAPTLRSSPSTSRAKRSRGDNGFPAVVTTAAGAEATRAVVIPAAAVVGPAVAAAGARHPGGSNAPQLDGKKIMQEIASRTGGQFFEAKKKENLEDIYGLIAGALRQQYLLTYTPDQVDTEGDFHKIVLKTGNNDLTVVTREGYYPPSSDK